MPLDLNVPVAYAPKYSTYSAPPVPTTPILATAAGGMTAGMSSGLSHFAEQGSLTSGSRLTPAVPTMAEEYSNNYDTANIAKQEARDAAEEAERASDDVRAKNAAAFTPEQSKDPRYEFRDVKFPVDAASRASIAFTDYDPNELSEIDKRVGTMDLMRAGADDDTRIAYMRVIAYQQGRVFTQKQIFPREKGGKDPAYNTYKKFIVSSMSINKVERQQIIKTNKAMNAYFFNSSPEVVALQGFLKTSPNDPWDIAMIFLWDKLIRGTQLALNHAILEIGIAETTYWGYPLSFSYQLQANSQYVSSFAMQILIIDSLLNATNVDERIYDQFKLDNFENTKTNDMVENDYVGIMAQKKADAAAAKAREKADKAQEFEDQQKAGMDAFNNRGTTASNASAATGPSNLPENTDTPVPPMPPCGFIADGVPRPYTPPPNPPSPPLSDEDLGIVHV